MKKIRLVVLLLVVLAILAVAWHLRFGGVTHERIVAVVDDRAEAVMSRVDARCDALDRKLDRIEAKLDRLLEIATRPLPDGMREVL